MHTMLSHSTRVYYNPRKIDVSRQLLRVCILLVVCIYMHSMHTILLVLLASMHSRHNNNMHNMHTNELVVCILELVVLCILLVRVVNYNSRAMYYYSITELVYWSMNTGV